MAMRRKYRGKVQLTSEFLRSILKLPGKVEITSMEFNPNRDIITIYYSSDDIIDGVTFRIEEGQEIPPVGYDKFYKKGE